MSILGFVFSSLYSEGFIKLFLDIPLEASSDTWRVRVQSLNFQIQKLSQSVVTSHKLDLANCKDLMQGRLFQRCTHLLYCSVLSPGGNVNTRRMSKPDMGSIFHINNEWNILAIGNYYVNYQNDQNSMVLTFSEH